MDELRKLAAKAGARFDAGTADYQVHVFAVKAAEGRTAGDRKLAGFINKALDRRYVRAIRDFRRERTPQGLLERWARCIDAGDIPGPYWALSTHPAATDEVHARAFGDVHMLSHQLGAANRADLRALRTLRADGERLAESATEAERKLRRRLDARDDTVAALRRDLAAEKAARATLQQEKDRFEADAAPEAARLRAALGKACRQLGVAGNAMDRLRDEVQSLTVRCRAQEEALVGREAECRALEAQLLSLAGPAEEPAGETGAVAANLSGSKVLYLGGRKNLYPHFRDVVSRCNGEFIPHDGGVEDGARHLHGALAKADIVLCPIDCVSHGACLEAKKHCSDCGKCFVPLKSSSLASLMTGLAHAAGARPAAGPPKG